MGSVSVAEMALTVTSYLPAATSSGGFTLMDSAWLARGSTAMEAICVLSVPGFTATFQPAGAMQSSELSHGGLRTAEFSEI